jgi:hypothetical protein
MRHDAPLGRVEPEPVSPEAGPRWFSDEIAVDFPAVPPLVERMRCAFFAGDEPGDAAVSGELRLTREQAARGGLVWADVPIRCTCRACGGRGETWGERCADCGGHGEGVARRTVEVAVPSGVRHGTHLHFRVPVPAAPDVAVRLLVRVG